MKNNKLIGMMFVFILVFSINSIFVFSDDESPLSETVLFYTEARCKDNGKIKNIGSTYSMTCPNGNDACVGGKSFHPHPTWRV